MTAHARSPPGGCLCRHRLPRESTILDQNKSRSTWRIKDIIEIHIDYKRRYATELQVGLFRLTFQDIPEAMGGAARQTRCNGLGGSIAQGAAWRFSGGL